VDEVERIQSVYAGYREAGRSERWAADRGIHAERRALLAAVLARLVPEDGARPPRVLDLGCGRGDLLDELVAAGIPAGAVVGVDLLEDRLASARDRGLATVLASGGALPFAHGTFDLVTAFTLVSSVGDDDLLASMATEVERVLAPGGALVVYDMRLPSPGNPSVRPLPRRRLASLFPGWTVTGRSCTLVPPVARRLAPEPGRRYRTLAAVPALRSHRLSVLRPPGSGLGLGPLPSEPTVSVVLPVRNEGSFIDQSLGAVLNQEGVAPAQVIVVDGNSDDGTAERARAVAAERSAAVSVLDNPDRIVPISMNLGLGRATGDVIVRVDGHCVIAPDYLRRCLDALAATGAECVGGPMATVGETPTARAIAAAQSSRVGVGGVAFRTSTEAAWVDTLAFGAYRREVFDRIGTFDEALVRNQDDELNLRLTRAGGRIWMDPSVRSTYFSRGTLAGLWRQYHGYGFYKLAVMRKHRTVPSPRHLAPAAFVGAAAGSVALSALRRTPWPVAAVLGPYALAVGTSSAAAGHRVDADVPTVAAATVAMHTAYGLGWWAGLFRAMQAILAARRDADRRAFGSDRPATEAPPTAHPRGTPP
jgi:SAM-dependent methyltransferase/GT2 family glycosyltransferase